MYVCVCVVVVVELFKDRGRDEKENFRDYFNFRKKEGVTVPSVSLF